MERVALRSADANRGKCSLVCEENNAYLAGWFMSHSEPSSRLFGKDRRILL
jgi:hypothetical protein